MASEICSFYSNPLMMPPEWQITKRNLQIVRTNLLNLPELWIRCNGLWRSKDPTVRLSHNTGGRPFWSRFSRKERCIVDCSRFRCSRCKYIGSRNPERIHLQCCTFDYLWHIHLWERNEILIKPKKYTVIFIFFNHTFMHCSLCY